MNTFTLLKQTPKRKKLLSIASIFITAGVLASSIVLGSVQADEYDDKINQLKAENSTLQTQTNTLSAEAATFEAAIANLREQIANLEAQISANEQKKRQLEAEIAQTEAEMAHHKKILGQNIRAMYLEDEISTFEILASSNDLGQFMDKEQYRNEVKDKVASTIETINTLKRKLDEQKASVEKVIADQSAIQADLNTQRAEQDRLLALNQAQRNELTAQMQSNSSEMSKLRAEQAAANAALFGNGVRYVVDGTGYPWANYPFPNSSADDWGMYKRQCVSYTAWKVAASGRHMPYWGGRGNAKQWDDNARAAGIPVDNNPRVGDVAVSNSGTYGHVMYVEAVYGDGTIYVSQYNANWNGTYSEARIPIGSLVFIHF